jgi:hypothetical protein
LAATCKSRGAAAAVAAVAVVVVVAVCVPAGAVAAGAAAAVHAGDGAACAKFHDLTDERQNLTNCHAADRSRRWRLLPAGGMGYRAVVRSLR